MPLPLFHRIAIALGLVAGSYVLAALFNAAPITQAALNRPYARPPLVIVVQPEEGGDAAAGPRVEPARAVEPVRKAI